MSEAAANDTKDGDWVESVINFEKSDASPFRMTYYREVGWREMY